jgi:hypothetical protein
VQSDPSIVQQVMARRLKDDVLAPDGSPKFPGRVARSIDVAYTDGEKRSRRPTSP